MSFKFRTFLTIFAFILSLSTTFSRTLNSDGDVGTLVELIENGTSYRFVSKTDGMVITVLPTGRVIADEWKGGATQRWTIVEHFRDSFQLEFKNDAFPYNDFSGWEDDPNNPGLFPRMFTLNKHRIMPGLFKGEEVKVTGVKVKGDDTYPTEWNIVIRHRWCIQNHGRGNIIEIDDCETMEPAPWQLWYLELAPPPNIP